jgi:hypothetical protein
MTTRIAKKKPSFRYASEDLKSRDATAESAAEKFVARNRDILNEDLKAARASIKAGRGKRYHSPDDLAAEMRKNLRPDRKR